MVGSNHRHPGSKPGALPTELTANRRSDAHKRFPVTSSGVLPILRPVSHLGSRPWGAYWKREAGSNRRSLAYEANGLPDFPIPRIQNSKREYPRCERYGQAAARTVFSLHRCHEHRHTFRPKTQSQSNGNGMGGNARSTPFLNSGADSRNRTGARGLEGPSSTN